MGIERHTKYTHIQTHTFQKTISINPKNNAPWQNSGKMAIPSKATSLDFPPYSYTFLESLFIGLLGQP